MGSNISCPWIDHPDRLLQYPFSNFKYSTHDAVDSLMLNDLTSEDVDTPKDPYRLLLTRFLRDPNRSGCYTIGDATYTAAALFLIESLGKLLGRSNRYEASDTEHSLSNRLILEGGRWVFRFESDSTSSFSELGFLLLGYIDFPSSMREFRTAIYIFRRSYAVLPPTQTYPATREDSFSNTKRPRRKCDR